MKLKKIVLVFGILVLIKNDYAATACGPLSSLKVGVVNNNSPYSAVDGSGQLFGFDPELACAIAKMLGLPLFFVIFPDTIAAGLALQAGQINMVANSSLELTDIVLENFGAIVTDMSHITNANEPQGLGSSPLRGWLFNRACCALMYQVEAALSALVANGTYATILQRLRQDPREIGFANGMGQFSFSNTGINKLVEPLPFHSSMAGTIPANSTGASGCLGQKQVLPQTTCMSQFVIQSTPCTFTITGI